MEITKTQNERTALLSLAGRLDTNTSPRLRETFLEIFDNSDIIEIDFSGVDYVSSAGLRVLLMGQKNSNSRGKTMELKNVSQKVIEIFKITGFTDVFSINKL